MLVRLTRTLVPSVRASPTAVKPARLGFSPAARASFASRVKPMHTPPEQLSPVVAALPSSQRSALLMFSQPTLGGVHRSVVHGFPSTQFLGVPRQAPAVQVSATVQTFPSVQASPSFRLTEPHTPAPLQALLVQIVGAVQGEPRGSNLQAGEQQSPASVLPSSQSSPASRIPLPQTSIVWPVMTKRGVCTRPTGRPGPSTWKKLVPQGLPVMVWGVRASPMKPGGGGVSQVRKVEPTGPASASENAVGTTEIGTAPTVTVSLITPKTSAVSVFTPYGWVTV